jgi:FAD/FMN-containing dehydrogenase
MAVATIDEKQLEQFQTGFSGPVLAPGNVGYEEARCVHNGLIDKRPALIARCRGTADVVAAVRLAREAQLEIAVRSGGHSVAGLSTIDGGLLIDLSLMKGVHVDQRGQTARAQAGLTWGELNRETGLFGLAVTGGIVSTTGIAGLTLGGGFGWLMGAYGLAADNLVAAQVVVATGDVLCASSDENPELFWALRGGGGNFGIVTSFKYRLHPVEQVVGGIVAHSFEAARDVLRLYRELVAEAPDELGLIAALVHAPDGSGIPLAAVAICHSGESAQAESDLASLLEFGNPVLCEVGPTSYQALNTMLDAGYPAGALNYWKSSFLRDLTDDVIDTLVEAFASTPSAMTQVAIESFHGAVTRIGVGETAVPHREAGFNVLITSVWTDPAATDSNLEWTQQMYGKLRPALSDRRYANYLDADDRDAAQAAYGPNHARLAALKRRYDPGGVFQSTLRLRSR